MLSQEQPLSIEGFAPIKPNKKKNLVSSQYGLLLFGSKDQRGPDGCLKHRAERREADASLLLCGYYIGEFQDRQNHGDHSGIRSF